MCMTNSGCDRVCAWGNNVPFEIKDVQKEPKKCAKGVKFCFLTRLNSRSWSLWLIENGFEREQSDLKCRLGGMQGVINWDSETPPVSLILWPVISHTEWFVSTNASITPRVLRLSKETIERNASRLAWIVNFTRRLEISWKVFSYRLKLIYFRDKNVPIAFKWIIYI